MFKQSKLLLVLFIIFIGAASAETLKTGSKVGELAPEFKLKALAGSEYSLSELKANGHVLLVFWATECVYCYAHVADLKKLHQQYANNGLTLAAINIGGEYEVEVKEYVKGNELNYLILSNRLKNLDVAEAYRVFGTPTLLLISPAGEILYRGHDIPDVSNWLKLARK